MSVKRILTALRLDKIAAVDRPCQQPATADLIKRAAEFDDLTKAKYTTEQRDQMAGKEAMPDGSYPIKDAEDLSNAIHAVGRGRSNSHTAIRRHIMARAKSLGLEDKIPETWSDGGKLAKSLRDVFEKSAVPLDDPDGDEGAQAFEEVLGEQELTSAFWDAWYKGTSALQESLCSIIKDGSVADKSSKIEESLKQFADYIEQILPGDVGKSLAAGIAASVGQPGTTTGEVMTPELKKALGLPETASEADVLKAIGDNKDALAKANEELEKAKKVPANQQADGGVDDPDDDDMAKVLASGDAFQDLTGRIITKKAAGALYDVVKAQDAEIKKAREAEEERSFAKRAEDIGCVAAFGSTIRKAYGGDAAAQAELEKHIAALTKQVEEGDLFKNFGHRAPAEDSAAAEFMAKVDEVRKNNPKLTEAQAYSRAYTDRGNADLVKRMKAEDRAQAN